MNDFVDPLPSQKRHNSWDGRSYSSHLSRKTQASWILICFHTTPQLSNHHETDSRILLVHFLLMVYVCLCSFISLVCIDTVSESVQGQACFGPTLWCGKHNSFDWFGGSSIRKHPWVFCLCFTTTLPGTCLICPRSPYVKQRRLHGRGACSGLGRLRRSERGWWCDKFDVEQMKEIHSCSMLFLQIHLNSTVGVHPNWFQLCTLMIFDAASRVEL